MTGIKTLEDKECAANRTKDKKTGRTLKHKGGNNGNDNNR